jgi:hypothetical protein
MRYYPIPPLHLDRIVLQRPTFVPDGMSLLYRYRGISLLHLPSILVTSDQLIPPVEEMTYLTGDGECMTNLRFTRPEFTYPSASRLRAGFGSLPNSSVIAPVSIPPPKIVSNPVDPVDICTNSDLLEWISVAVVNPIGTILHAIISSDNASVRDSLPSVKILSALASLIPLIVRSCFLGVKATASTVWYPALTSLSVSDAEIPASYS